MGTSVNFRQKPYSVDVEYLCIHSIASKLKKRGRYDIGGCYDADGEYGDLDLWFFFTTSKGPGDNYLLNLFVYNIQAKFVAIDVSTKNNPLKAGKGNVTIQEATERVTCKRNTSLFHIKTFRFTKAEIKFLEDNGSIIYIYIQITAYSELSAMHIDEAVLSRIRLEHHFSLSPIMTKQKKTDCTLVSRNGKTLGVHRIVLIAHSTVFNELLKDSMETNINVDLEDYPLELMVDFLYNGCLKKTDISACIQLLDIADKFKIKNLSRFAQNFLAQHVSVARAIDLAILSQKYGLDWLQYTVFTFIRANPNVLETDGWKDLDDIDLAKKLLQYIHGNKSSVRNEYLSN